MGQFNKLGSFFGKQFFKLVRAAHQTRKDLESLANGLAEEDIAEERVCKTDAIRVLVQLDSSPVPVRPWPTSCHVPNPAPVSSLQFRSRSGKDSFGAVQSHFHGPVRTQSWCDPNLGPFAAIAAGPV